MRLQLTVAAAAAVDAVSAESRCRRRRCRGSGSASSRCRVGPVHGGHLQRVRQTTGGVRRRRLGPAPVQQRGRAVREGCGRDGGYDVARRDAAAATARRILEWTVNARQSSRRRRRTAAGHYALRHASVVRQRRQLKLHL